MIKINEALKVKKYKVEKDMPLNGLRRNDDAIEITCPETKKKYVKNRPGLRQQPLIKINYKYLGDGKEYKIVNKGLQDNQGK